MMMIGSSEDFVRSGGMRNVPVTKAVEHLVRTLGLKSCVLLPATSAVFLNLEQRIEILRQYEKGKSARKLAELFYCGRTQINKIIKEEDLILKEYEDFKFRGVKRMRHEKYVDINEAALEWFKTVRAKKIPVSGPMIQHKVKELTDALGIENFSASNGWLDIFRIRNKITVWRSSRCRPQFI
ncbi:Tigger transposable element-derived protein 4 [Araneus ventricosus]|uniref:Tigger transposable element-derived protein 4 n=1 Tax=Araneus ventricosus TaxID=182803 RepID=A0A4Y2MDX9_ARAVE|nr:Tigger transposable element-derived protein 4 [Araneus ventricosus]